MMHVTLENIREARLERAIDFVRATLPNAETTARLRVPTEDCPLSYAILARGAVARAARLSIMPDADDRIERAIEITREAYAKHAYPVSLLKLSLLDGLSLALPETNNAELAVHYTEVAALALRLSVEAGDFV